MDTKNDTKAQIEAAYVKAVKERLIANGAQFGPDGKITAKANGWGSKDSVAVIESIVDAAYLGDEPEGFDGVKEKVEWLVNPSAYRQKLEKKGAVVEGERGKRNAGVDALASMGF